MSEDTSLISFCSLGIIWLGTELCFEGISFRNLNALSHVLFVSIDDSEKLKRLSFLDS